MSNHERNRTEELIVKNNINVSDMHNKGRKIAFINDNFQYSKDLEIITALQRFNQYGIIEKTINKDLLEFLRSDFFYFFESFAWGYSSFNTNKGIMKAYLDWGRDQHLTDSKVSQVLEDIKYDDPSHKKMFETYYFKSLSELNQEIENFKTSTITVDKAIKFRIAETTLYLAWFGIKIKDACVLRMIDINQHDKSIFIQSKNQTIHINQQDNDEIDAFEKIVEYKNSSDYTVSDILLRTETQPNMTVGYLSNVLSKYFGDNDFNDHKDKIINYTKMYWSGIYSRTVLEFGCKDLDGLSIKELSDIFQEDYDKLANPQPAISKRLIEYKDYLINLYGSEYLKS